VKGYSVSHFADARQGGAFEAERSGLGNPPAQAELVFNLGSQDSEEHDIQDTYRCDRERRVPNLIKPVSVSAHRDHYQQKTSEWHENDAMHEDKPTEFMPQEG